MICISQENRHWCNLEIYTYNQYSKKLDIMQRNKRYNKSYFYKGVQEKVVLNWIILVELIHK